MSEDMTVMTEDTRRALEIIKPIADFLHIEVSADWKLLYVNNMAIGIACNSAYATVMEFLGFLLMSEYPKFRDIQLSKLDIDNIERYWICGELLQKMKDGDNE